MGMKGIEGDISAGPGRSGGRVADRGSKICSDIFFPLAQIIPINPHHPHHFGTFDILCASLIRVVESEGSIRPAKILAVYLRPGPSGGYRPQRVAPAPTPRPVIDFWNYPTNALSLKEL
jgi:hypothetical protein